VQLISTAVAMALKEYLCVYDFCDAKIPSASVANINLVRVDTCSVVVPDYLCLWYRGCLHIC